MLTVTGTAEFTKEGRLLETTLIVQPHFPVEHDQLERVAKFYAVGGATLENGQLVIRRTYVVPTDAEVEQQVRAEAVAKVALEGANALEGNAQSAESEAPEQSVAAQGTEAASADSI